MNLRPTIAFVVPLMFSAGLLSGCGKDQAADTANATAGSSKSESSTVAFKPTMTGTELSEIARRAQAKVTSYHVESQMTMGKSPMTVSADVQRTGSAYNFDVVEKMMGKQIRLRFLGADHRYFKNDGKGWKEAVGAEKKALQATFGNTVKSIESSSTMLGGDKASYKMVGRPTVGGVPTTAYTATLSGEALKSLGAENLGASTSQIAKMKITTELDGNGLVRRTTTDSTMKNMAIHTVANLSRYNQIAPITAPK